LEQRHQEVFECVAVAVGHRVVGVCVHGVPTVLVLALRTQDVADRVGDALNFTKQQNNPFLSFGLKCLSLGPVYTRAQRYQIFCRFRIDITYDNPICTA
jgi:hypothetical protein